MVATFAPDDRQILEIGPGHGALTDLLVDVMVEAMADTTAEAHAENTPLTVVELDRDLAQRLAKRYPPQRVKVIQADILDFQLRDVINANNPDARLRVIGNLPYNISTPLIFHLLAQVEYIHDMQFMLQKEVALRLAAAPGDKNYGKLSVMAAMELDCELLFDIPPQAFNPPPKVHSTALRLIPKKQPLSTRNRKLFNRVVAAAFSQRRKTMRNALATLAQPEHFIQAGIESSLRAERLSVEEFIALANAIADACVDVSADASAEDAPNGSCN